MPRKQVLINVTTYPLPSRSYDELVCTAGIDEDGSWVRIYPVPLSFFPNLKKGGKTKSVKYKWIELDLKKRTDDFRPESYSPENYNFSDLEFKGYINTNSNWAERKEWCLRNVYTNLSQLLKDSKEPKNTSLATFKPSEILDFIIEPDDREWKNEWKELRKQQSLFENVKEPEKMIPKLPYKFYYRFKDDEGKISKLMIEDWEIGTLYWNCLKIANGDEDKALDKVRDKFEKEFVEKKELYLFLGTTKQWHMRRANNPFVIIGVFYPKKEDQMKLF